MYVPYAFIAVCTQIDDQQVTYEQILDMDLRDVTALLLLVNKYVNGPIMNTLNGGTG